MKFAIGFVLGVAAVFLWAVGGDIPHPMGGYRS